MHPVKEGLHIDTEKVTQEQTIRRILKAAKEL
jgi:hypothetical protein